MPNTPATHEEIVQRFLAIPFAHIRDFNWGTAPKELESEWHVNTETYINGVMVTLDGDYRMGYLLEVVDRTSGEVRYVAILQFEFGEHDSMMYDGLPVGTFFDRNVHPKEIDHWAIDAFYAMVEKHDHE